jgi:O-antigen/teichoic acid export membrane protein
MADDLSTPTTEDWSVVVRGESVVQRLDRHYTELLQEMRVAQTGVQILFGFLLGLAFTQRFDTLPPVEHAVYLVTLVAAAGAAGLVIAPVSYHRVVYQRRMRERMVTAAHGFLRVGLLLLTVSFAGAVQVAATFVVGAWSWALCALVLGAYLVWWYVIPLRHRLGAVGEPEL